MVKWGSLGQKKTSWSENRNLYWSTLVRRPHEPVALWVIRFARGLTELETVGLNQQATTHINRVTTNGVGVIGESPMKMVLKDSAEAFKDHSKTQAKTSLKSWRAILKPLLERADSWGLLKGTRCVIFLGNEQQKEWARKAQNRHYLLLRMVGSLQVHWSQRIINQLKRNQNRRSWESQIKQWIIEGIVSASCLRFQSLEWAQECSYQIERKLQALWSPWMWKQNTTRVKKQLDKLECEALSPALTLKELDPLEAHWARELTWGEAHSLEPILLEAQRLTERLNAQEKGLALCCWISGLMSDPKDWGWTNEQGRYTLVESWLVDLAQRTLDDPLKNQSWCQEVLKSCLEGEAFYEKARSGGWFFRSHLAQESFFERLCQIAYPEEQVGGFFKHCAPKEALNVVVLWAFISHFDHCSPDRRLLHEFEYWGEQLGENKRIGELEDCALKAQLKIYQNYNLFQMFFNRYQITREARLLEGRIQEQADLNQDGEHNALKEPAKKQKRL